MRYTVSQLTGFIQDQYTGEINDQSFLQAAQLATTLLKTLEENSTDQDRLIIKNAVSLISVSA